MINSHRKFKSSCVSCVDIHHRCFMADTRDMAKKINFGGKT